MTLPARTNEYPISDWYVGAMRQLLEVVQQLSHARDYETITSIVRVAARNLTGADGATFVLRDGNKCFYADENAISPLWKGMRFPMSSCISGWVMLNAQPALIEDIYVDPRIPHDAYRPTFVKSLAMVPIRKDSPIGAIGNYWATKRMPTPEEVSILQALADTTSVALENAQLYGELQSKVQALQESNYELNRFAWVASHDLQEPLRTIVTQVELLERSAKDKLTEQECHHIQLATHGAGRLQHLIEDLLVHAQAEKVENFRPLALSDPLQHAQHDLHALIMESKAEIRADALPWVNGNGTLLSRLFQNLIANAIKFRSPGMAPLIEISTEQQDSTWVISVKDNGIGIEKDYLESIFGLFQRLHPQDQYPGSGIGLATCKKIVELHGGRIGVESTPGKGSIFHFTLPVPYLQENHP